MPYSPSTIMVKMKNFNKLIRFLIIVFMLYFIWFILYDHVLGRIDFWLTVTTSDVSVWFLSSIGYKAENYIISYDAVNGGSMITIDGNDVVSIGPPCNALVLIALYSGFIIAYPGKIINKLLFIPLGIAIIFIVNVSRVTALALNSLYHFQTLDFNHKYTFTIVVYAVIFCLWMIWVKKFSGLNTNVEKSLQTTPTV